MYRSIFLLLMIPGVAFGQHAKLKNRSTVTGKETLLTKRPQKTFKKFSMPDSEDVNKIIKTVISQQTIVMQYDASGKAMTAPSHVSHYNWLTGMSLSVDLMKANILSSDPGYKTLFDTTRPCFFSKVDSSCLVFQNNNFYPFKVDTTAIPTMKFTSVVKQRDNQKKGSYSYYYRFTVPVFSTDKKIAYIQLDCYFGYGRGYEFFLKKNNDKWLIAYQTVTWMQ